MKTFKIINDFENYYSFTIKGVELYSKMPDYSPRFGATSRQADWVAPTGSFYPSQNYANPNIALPDITTWVTGNLVLNYKAFAVLKEKLKDSGEFLGVFIEGIEFSIFNTLKVIEDKYINKEKAKEVIDGGVNAGLENISFATEGLGDAMVFKSQTDHVLHTYCTESFVELVNEHDLSGLLFEEMVIV